MRLESFDGKMIMYFCPVKAIENLKTVTPGDGGSIPAQAVVQGLPVPGTLSGGFFSSKNVHISSNGSIQVLATPDTRWEAVTTDDYPF